MKKIILSSFLFFPLTLLAQWQPQNAAGTDVGNVYHLNGNVGIGTSAPTTRFEIIKPSANNYSFAYRDALPGNDSYLYHSFSTNFHLIGSSWNGTGVQRKIGFAVGNTDSEADIKMSIDKLGKVGIGTTQPQAFLDIAPNLDVTVAPGKLGSVLGRLQEGQGVGDGTFLGVRGYATSTTIFSGKSFAIEHNFYGLTNSSINFHRGGGTTGGYLTFNTNNNTEQVRILSNGSVGIGTTTTGTLKLAVEGKIGAREVNVLVGSWPDYVFEKNYDLRTLAEVENYINQNKHLPEVPAAKEMETNGVNLGEMNMLLLKKVEELTLYVIELKKEIEKVKRN